ncbi:hypothetical protein AYX19_21575 (plasmid) [Paenarthrobacter ureafaciens]|nr:TetR/AcrR family transcriptional regulator [Paenarthrobacter ureafaciens]QSZ51255.1 hypothetical protein AYX22_22200 [Arthrobacter sp. D5-1]QSZ55597.1 hypothetical protein AYX19_21105 [Paenarthrobacter ureafaciens]QSZ55679.1 hypothetical protein AYX19_21575 [Paenarthrobacter ureafaciens]
MVGAARAEQIIQATIRLIADRGYWGLSMQDVADTCGLTVPGILHHVASKEGLLTKVLEYVDAEDERLLSAELGLDSGLPYESWAGQTSLADVCAAAVRANVRRPELVRFLLVLQAESLSLAHPAHKHLMERDRRAIDRLAVLDASANDRSRARAIHAYSTLIGLQMMWCREPEAFDLVGAWATASNEIFKQDQ